MSSTDARTTTTDSSRQSSESSPLGSLTAPELIFPDLAGTDRPGVLHELADRMAEANAVQDAELLYRRLLEREELGSTAVGSGVAIPHCKMEDLESVVLAIGLSKEGVDFESEDGERVRLFFVVVSPSDSPAVHLRSLAAISKWVKADHHVEHLLETEKVEEVLELLRLEGS